MFDRSTSLSTVSYENVRLYVMHPNADFRVALASQLMQLGFVNAPSTSLLAKGREFLEEEGADLLVLAPELQDGGTYELVQDIRRGAIDGNPFPIILMLLDNPTTESVRAAVSAGVDKILVSPITSGLVVERIKALTKARKEFVMTHDYVGPDRRTQPRDEGEDAVTLFAPNPLDILTRAKNPDVYKTIVERAVVTVQQGELIVDARQLVHATNRVRSVFADNPGPEACSKAVQHLKDLLASLKDRAGAGQNFELVQLCENLIAVADRLGTNVSKPDQKDILVAPKIAEAILAVIRDSSSAGLVTEELSGKLQNRPAADP